VQYIEHFINNLILILYYSNFKTIVNLVLTINLNS